MPASRQADSPAGPEEPRGLSPVELARRCAQETSQYFNRRPYDPRFCLELFRRALAEADQLAWEAIFSQYRPLVAGWVIRHPAFHRCQEDELYFVNRAFEKLWSARSGRGLAGLGDLAGILRYLQMCVHSAVVDHLRQSEPERGRPAASAPPASGPKPEPSAYDSQLDRVEREEFWAAIERKLRDEKERRVIYASYVIGLKPQEICAAFHHLFRSPEDVYLAKQNVLARLRRDPDLRRSLGIGD